MKKIIKKIIQILIMVIVITLIYIGGFGYINYKKVIYKVSVSNKIAEVRSKKNYVKYDDVSPYLINATVAIEDRRFYSHHGIDVYSLVRAMITNLYAKEITGGGSTITQQLAKNLYFGYEPSYIRKVSEMFVARDLEKELSKEEIIELYINVINYGDNNFGIYEASENYFNKDPKYLTINEAALLAGIPQSPVNFQLSNHYEDALIRKEQVVEAMKEQNMLDGNEFE